MNIFLPHENDIQKSVQDLDNVRLNKQAVETCQLLTLAIKEKNGEIIKGHSHHPVYLFYKGNPKFLAYYGLACCEEFYYRQNKHHSLAKYFSDKIIDLDMIIHNENFVPTGNDLPYSIAIPLFIPYYMEGSKGSPNCIRTTENVSQLFRDKLIKKWQADIEKNRPPKWTGRDCPSWANEFLELSHNF